VLFCSSICAAPLNDTNSLNDIEEAHKLQTLLEATRASTTLAPKTSTTSSSTTSTSIITTARSEPVISGGNKPHQNDQDYSFQNDRLPLLSEDEFNNLSDDANPLHFLKQLPEPISPPAAETKPDSVPAGSPIYITIPIYINTSGKIPISLTIGEQEVRLNSSHKTKNYPTKAPNSYFNRLLEPLEPPKRRTTNRHRSNPSRSKIQALKEHKPKQFDKIEDEK
ncbi:hypothetical protein KR222_008821, partial [Zaprionus bogoriensis]